MQLVVTAAEDFIDRAGDLFGRRMSSDLPEDMAWAEKQREEGRTMMDAQQDAREFLIRQRASALIEGTIGTYGQTGLFDHKPSVDLIRKIMGDKFVDDEIELIKSFNREETVLSDREENLGSEEAIRTGMEEAEAKNTSRCCRAGRHKQPRTNYRNPRRNYPNGNVRYRN